MLPRRTKSASQRAEHKDGSRARQTKNGSSLPNTNADGVPGHQDMPGFESTIPRDEFDEYGNELSRDARVWPAYLKEAHKWDEDRVDGWNRSLDVTLVFAALFSAISTAFVIESSKNLQKDSAESTANGMLEVTSLLRAIAEGRPVTSMSNNSSTLSEFTPSVVVVCVNTLWFLSLSLSLSVSLVAMLAKQWCYYYISGRTGQPHVQARQRQRRLDGLERWKMMQILAILPTLMHFSLVLFFIGLTLYLWNIHTTVAIPVLLISAMMLIFYVTTTVLPIGASYCPYNTPLSQYIEVALRNLLSPFEHTRFIRRFFARQQQKDTAADLSGPLADGVTSQALSWLITNSHDTHSVDLTLQAIAGDRSGMPVEPLEQRGVVHRLVGRFMECFTIHPKTGRTCLGSDKQAEVASLYGRALVFLISNASDRVAIASELRAASGTAQDKRALAIDRGYGW